MNSWLSAYLSLQFTLALALGVSIFLTKIDARIRLKFEYLSLSLIFVLFCSRPWLPQHQVFQPRIKIFSADQQPCCQKPPASATNLRPLSSLSWGERPGAAFETLDLLAYVLLVWAALAGGWIFGELAIFRRRLNYLVRAHKIGRAEVYYATEPVIPFAAWLPGRRIVVLPPPDNSFLSLSIVRTHELQHHRQHDTVTAVFFRFLQLFCFWNPLVHLWIRSVRRTQELACDATLVLHRGVPPQAYARCLWEAAKLAHAGRLELATGARGFGLLGRRPFLLRRIQMITRCTENQNSHMRTLALFGLWITVVLSFGSIATQKLIQDRRITQTQVKNLVSKSNRGAGIAVPLHDDVLKQLNSALGTAEDRARVQTNLNRMKSLRPQIEEKLKSAGFPSELLAIPLMESGYQNLPDKNDRGNGAGIWMFIKKTAQAYGLKTEPGNDQRLDIDKETDAAIAYFKKLHAKFGQWDLAILAYNCGENAVQTKMDELKTKNVWKVIAAGVANDPDYLATIYAGILILKNPDLAG